MIQVKVWSPDNPTRVIETAALLDTGSTRTFCSAQLLDELGSIPTPGSLRVNTLNHADETIQSAVGMMTHAEKMMMTHAEKMMMTRAEKMMMTHAEKMMMIRAEKMMIVQAEKMMIVQAEEIMIVHAGEMMIVQADSTRCYDQRP